MNPQDIIASHCAALLELVPGNVIFACARELALRSLYTESALVTLCELVSQIAKEHDQRSAMLPVLGELLDLLGPNDVPVTVAEIREESELPGLRIWRIENSAQLRMYAWADVQGWETTGWGYGFFADDIDPVPGRDDLPRGAWPVGLAKLVAEALADNDTSEPWDGEETLA